jgi:hypothetical protein
MPKAPQPASRLLPIEERASGRLFALLRQLQLDLRFLVADLGGGFSSLGLGVIGAQLPDAG